MRPITERIDDLDLSVFDLVPSQTSDAEKRSLLAVQRAVARRFGAYNYLEIGSHLGGSLQPHVRDPRCAHIDSIDLRPQTAAGNPLVDAVRTVASALSPQTGPIEWQVIATLDIPWGKNLTSSVDVVVTK